MSASPSPLRRAFLRQAASVAASLCAFAAALPAHAQQRSAPLPAGVQRIADVPYGPDPAQRMDGYVPARATAGAAPVIFMVHGGGWRVGDKAMGRVVQEKVNRWLPKGFVFISINYRLLPDAPVAVQQRDVQAALMAAQQRAGTWGEIRTASSSWATLLGLIWWPCAMPAPRRPCAKGPGRGWARWRSMGS